MSPAAGTDSGVSAEDCIFSGDLSVCYPNNYLSGLRFALTGSSNVSNADLLVPAILDTSGLNADAKGFSGLSIDVGDTEVALNGNFGDIALDDPDTILTIDSGTVSSLTLSGSTVSKKHQVTVGSNGIISELNISSPSEIFGDGTLKSVIVNSSDSSIGADMNVSTNDISLINGLTIKVGNITLMAYGESAELSDLVLKNASGSEEIPMNVFSGSVTSYNAYTDADSVRVYPYTENDSENSYVIKVNGEAVQSGSYATVDTSDEDASIRIQVTCEGKNATIYTVTVAELVEPELKTLTVYNSDSKIYTRLSPSFDPSVTSYTVYSSGTNLKISAEAQNSGLEVQIGSNDVETGTAIASVANPASQKSIDVTVSNGTILGKTYSIKIIKQNTAGSIYCSGTTEGTGTPRRMDNRDFKSVRGRYFFDSKQIVCHWRSRFKL